MNKVESSSQIEFKSVYEEFFNLYFGYRFNDNKPMRKFFGWFEDTFGF